MMEFAENCSGYESFVFIPPSAIGDSIRNVSGNRWKGFECQRWKVKMICVQMCPCCSGRGRHSDGVALRQFK